MLGIEDVWIGSAYVLCLASTALCVVYAWRNWDRGDDAIQEADRKWAEEEKQVEENL